MNNANIGSASNVIGNPVNLIMSNATEEQLKKYDGNLGLPSHSLIIVNPLNNSAIDSTWNDICITDGNNGIKHIIPFTSIDKSQMYVETSDSGERTLHTSFPATSIDDTVFTYEKGVLSFKGLENLDSKISDFNNKIQGIVSNAEQTIDDYNTVATKYKTLIDSINSLAEQDDIVTQIENKAESIKKTIDDINDYTINSDIENKITYTNTYIDKLSYNQTTITNQIDKIESLISDFIPNDDTNESEVLKNINDTVNKTNEALEQSKNEFEQYKNVVDNLVDNTKDELHREYEALKNSLNDCVNNNLLPLVEAQVDTCLANDKVAELFDGAVEKILTEQDTKAEAGILNSVSRALNGEGNATTVSEASNNLNSAINTIVKDRSSVAISEFSETVSKAIQPKYVDKRYFDVIQLSKVDSNAPDNEKQYTVITLSKPLRDFFKNQLGESAFSSLHGAIKF